MLRPTERPVLSSSGSAVIEQTELRNRTIAGLPTEADFATLGFDEPSDSPGVKILSATFSLAGTGGIVKSMKQFEVSECVAADGCIGGGGQPPGVPEPSTWAMLMLGFAGLGYTAYRTAKAQPAFMACTESKLRI